MKLKDSKSVMEDVVAVPGVGSKQVVQVSLDERGRGHSPDPSPPASRSPSRMAASRRSRRNSVQMACERCRRRKIKCSGLPGPCHSCSRLNVACHDPGRRRDRVQSLLEDRIQRLEALALSNQPYSPLDTSSIASVHMNQPQSHAPIIAQPQPRPAVQVQTQNLANMSNSFDDVPSPFSSQSWDNYAIPASPACYSDIGPDMGATWPQGDYFQQTVDQAPSVDQALHRRAQTFPIIRTEDLWQIQVDDMAQSAGGLSDIPSIEITSYDSSRPQTPLPSFDEPLSPAGISIPFRSALVDHEEDADDAIFDLPSTPPLPPLNTRVQESSPIEYYGDRLSPLDQPPPMMARRASATSSDHSSLTFNFSDPTASFATPVSRTRIHRAQTLPASLAADQEVQQYISLTVDSPRTRNYAQIYFTGVHPEYPFLDPTTFHTNRSLAYRASGLASDPSQRRTTIPDAISCYQALVVAAIGAMVHHRSRTLSSQHVRHAMSLHPQIDTWGSVSGLHCAILLSIYCYLEATMSFSDEDQDLEDDGTHQKPHFSEPSHPPVNLWLHNCQVAAACIDLGMHVALTAEDETGMSGVGHQVATMARHTLRTAYTLDRKISMLRNRPRAFHDEDLDQSLIADLQT